MIIMMEIVLKSLEERWKELEIQTTALLKSARILRRDLRRLVVAETSVKNDEKHLPGVNNYTRGRIKTIGTTALSRSARILRRVLERPEETCWETTR